MRILWRWLRGKLEDRMRVCFHTVMRAMYSQEDYLFLSPTIVLRNLLCSSGDGLLLDRITPRKV